MNSSFTNEPNAKTIEQGIIQAEVAADLHNALSQLPNKCRIICTKYFVEEKSYADIAREMKLMINTVRVQKARGLSLMRKMRKW